MKNNAAEAAKSSAKDRANEKTYRISLSNGILEHCPDMLDSVWLFIWYIDKTTIEKNGEGSVLGGIPIRDSRPASALRMPVKTIRRWRLHLEAKGYIRTVRTSFGHVITLLKSKKWKRGPVLVPETPDPTQSDLPNGEITTNVNSRNGHSEFPKRALRIPKTVNTKKTMQLTLQEDKAEEGVKAAASAAGLLLKRKKEPAWKSIGLPPSGGAKFQAVWGVIHGERPRIEKLSDTMERCIQACQQSGIVVPGVFFEAKRRIENGESASVAKYPLADPLPGRCAGWDDLQPKVQL